MRYICLFFCCMYIFTALAAYGSEKNESMDNEIHVNHQKDKADELPQCPPGDFMIMGRLVLNFGTMTLESSGESIWIKPYGSVKKDE